jgi:hypothetical protein
MLMPLLVCLLLALARGGDPFADLGFEAAREKARNEERLLVIEFAASWCPHCKRMEQDVWSQPDVRAWLAQQAVAIRVDVDEERELAWGFGIQSHPTVVALKDGTELERLDRCSDVTVFRHWGEKVLESARTFDDLMRREVELGDSEDVGARYELAKDLFAAKRYDVALRHYLWLWPATRSVSAMRGVRVSFMLNDMADLAARHEPAARAFSALLEEVQGRVDALDKPTDQDWQEWSALCEHLGERPRIVRWYEQHRDDHGRLFGAPAEVQSGRLVSDVFKSLMAEGRIVDAVRLYGDARTRARELLADHERYRQAMAGHPTNELSERLARSMRERLANDLARLCAALLAIGRTDEAADVSTLLLGALDAPESRLALVRAGLQLVKRQEPCFTLWLDEAERAGADVRSLRAELAALPASDAGGRR